MQIKIPKDIIGQGENSDLSVLASQFDRELDKQFGINFSESELNISSKEDMAYKGIQSEALSTSYLDYHQIFTDLNFNLGKGITLLDLGAGYCRGTLLASINKVDYEVDCISIELERSRTCSAHNYLLEHHLGVDLIHNQDLLAKTFSFIKTDAIFLYLPAGALLNAIIRNIIKYNLKGCTLYTIESHGDFINNLKLYPEVFEEVESLLKTSTARHDPKIYKFAIRDTQNLYKKYTALDRKDILKLPELALWLLKYEAEDLEIVIESKIAGLDKFRVWKGRTLGMQLIIYNEEVSLQLKYPSRILQLETQDRITKIILS